MREKVELCHGGVQLVCCVTSCSDAGRHVEARRSAAYGMRCVDRIMKQCAREWACDGASSRGFMQLATVKERVWHCFLVSAEPCEGPCTGESSGEGSESDPSNVELVQSIILGLLIR